ncbi:hypothetical protein CYLTODRAFT_412800 [Cylindrobasidium torrendii FP15055 ss-10]|uniref:Fungal-type protein kinase domain-containing protein n=1 Tax=Cylindrobasidium torrendii FP15055 ss-10 TaxID=1314674 RepID=A0A0D7B3R9_9AGAR|nr:hypothetical protein CYLTODRAFT_412800 [Cylindrobasidium torrendii FP15055 ss-10]
MAETVADPANASSLPLHVADTVLHDRLASSMPFSSQEGIVQSRFELATKELDGRWAVYNGFGAGHSQLKSPTQEARDTRGQLVSYLNAMQANQYRTHGFGIFIVKNHCRILRHTRCGIEVTNAFNIDNTDYLPTFLWRLSHAADAARGIDTTFRRVKEADVPKNVKDVLHAKPQSAVWKLKVDGQDFYVTAPFTSAHPYPVGADVWRVEGYRKEGEVYQRLHEHKVQNIAGILASGDVPDEEHQWDIPGVVAAHLEAYTLAGIEHRDLSVGNIIAVRVDSQIKGLLIDWELARYADDTQARAYGRAGTRQFMSARLCSSHRADDIESFVLIMLWLSALYMPNDMDPAMRGGVLDHFDSSTSKINLYLGGVGRLKLCDPHLEDLLDVLMQAYDTRYRIFTRHTPQEKLDQAKLMNQRLETHGWMKGVFEQMLGRDEWRNGVRVRAHRQEYTPVFPAVAGLKRKSARADYGARNAKMRKKEDGELFSSSITEEDEF